MRHVVTKDETSQVAPFYERQNNIISFWRDLEKTIGFLRLIFRRKFCEKNRKTTCSLCRNKCQIRWESECPRVQFQTLRFSIGGEEEEEEVRIIYILYTYIYIYKTCIHIEKQRVKINYYINRMEKKVRKERKRDREHERGKRKRSKVSESDGQKKRF